MDVNFWASVVQIISIFFALYVFLVERRATKRADRTVYRNKLESLKFELIKNKDVIVGFLERDRKEFLEGTKIAYFRFSTGVINRLISDGMIEDPTLLRNLDAIAEDQNQANRIMDLIALMAETSQIGSAEERLMFERRIKTASITIIKFGDKQKKYLPLVIKDLQSHIERIII